MGLMNTELKDLDISRSLRRLGNMEVMEWDFRTVMPAVISKANQEVDIVDLFKRAASYKVMEWEFKSSATAKKVEVTKGIINPAEMESISLRLKNFLQYVVVNLISSPEQALIIVSKIGPTGLRFKLVLSKKDVSLLIGREGSTVGAIRNILQSAAERNGVQALLQIVSQEEVALVRNDG